jgi:hypothetical protein
LADRRHPIRAETPASTINVLPGKKLDDDYPDPSATHRTGSDPTILVAAVIAVEHLRHHGFEAGVWIRILPSALVTEERKVRQIPAPQAACRGGIDFEGDDGADLHRRSYALQARRLARYPVADLTIT